MKRTAWMTTWLFLIGLVFCAVQAFGAPTVTYRAPDNGDVNVPVDSAVSVLFSEPMQPTSLTNDSFRLTKPAAITAVAAGGLHNLALKDDGTMVAWGSNGYGESTVPTGLSGVKDIAAGYSFSVALKNDGKITAWGDDSFEQCRPPSWVSGFTAIAAGDEHALALRNGTVFGWGNNDSEQSSNVVMEELTDVIAIAAGGAQSLALKKDGTMVAWGGGVTSLVPVDFSGVSAIAAGSRHILALKSDHTVVTWGDSVVPAGLNNVVAIAAGWAHTVAVKSDGTVVVWGSNLAAESTLPSRATGITTIAAGYSHTVALKSDGTVISWGSIQYKQIPIPPEGSTDVTAIAAGFGHTVAVKKDGTVFAWGYNNAGQTNPQSGLNDVTAVAAGYSHTVALKKTGKVVAWGSNVSGESIVPTELSDVTVTAIAAAGYYTMALTSAGKVVVWGQTTAVDLNNVKAIAAGGSHMVALKSDGTVVAWGTNDYGQCDVPQDLTDVIAISAGHFHTVALRSDGSVVTWGYYSDQLGKIGSSRFTAVAAGGFHTVALKNDGTVMDISLHGSVRNYQPLSLYESLVFANVAYEPSTATATLTPTISLQPNQTYTATVWGRNAAGTPMTGEASWVFTTEEESNAPPILDAIGPQSVSEGGTLDLTLHASDPEGSAVSFSASGLPVGATLNSSSGIFKWSPSFNQGGNYPVTFIVSDGALSVSEEVVITVANIDRPPAIQPIGAIWAYEGDLVAFAVDALDPDGDPLILEVSDLPQGADFNSNNLTWQTNNSDAGSYAIVFTAQAGAQSAREVVSITVIDYDGSSPRLSMERISVLKEKTSAPILKDGKMVSRIEFSKEALSPPAGVAATFDVAASFTTLDPADAEVTVTTFINCPAQVGVFQVGDMCFDISTNANSFESVEICIGYDESTLSGSEQALKLRHYEDGRWLQMPTELDTQNNIICGTTSTLCPVMGSFNALPVIPTLTISADPQPVGSVITLEAPFTDKDNLDTHEAYIFWGDTTTGTNADVSEVDGQGTISATHAYSIPGVYVVKVVVTDELGAVGSIEHRYIVVYDPAAGFVSGSGWIDSPAGAYSVDDYLPTGKATFGFISRYQKGRTTPSGSTEFQFHAAGFDFKSDSYEWLVIAGDKASYKGVGTIKGVSEPYKFLLTVIDADQNRDDAFIVDLFRIKIWSEVEGSEKVKYDNGFAEGAPQEISSGSVVIHK